MTWFVRDPVGGATHFVPLCGECGKPGVHGYDVSLLKALRHKDPKFAGRWYCADHNPGQGDGDAREVDDEQGDRGAAVG